MLPSLRELGILSARLAEEEALLAKQRLNTATCVAPTNGTVASELAASKTSTIVSAPVPVTVAVRKLGANSVSSSSSSVASTSLPDSPVMSNSPPNTLSTECALAATILPLLAQRSSLQGSDKLPQIGLSFMPMTAAFQPSLPTQPGILVQTPMGLTQIPTVPTTVLTTTPQYVSTQQHVDVFSSLSSSRMRKPFHKRRPAHMDKNMLFCHFCGRKETPEWRKGPGGPATLCNACGLQWAKKIRAQRTAAASSPLAVSSPTSASAAAAPSSPSNSATEAALKPVALVEAEKSAEATTEAPKATVETAE